jgi:hypothetical protein
MMTFQKKFKAKILLWRIKNFLVSLFLNVVPSSHWKLTGCHKLGEIPFISGICSSYMYWKFFCWKHNFTQKTVLLSKLLQKFCVTKKYWFIWYKYAQIQYKFLHFVFQSECLGYTNKKKWKSTKLKLDLNPVLCERFHHLKCTYLFHRIDLSFLVPKLHVHDWNEMAWKSWKLWKVLTSLEHVWAYPSFQINASFVFVNYQNLECLMWKVNYK